MVNIHYCMGRLASVEYGIGEQDECNKCGMKERKGCCHTESTFLKIQDDHQVAKTLKVPDFFATAVPFTSLTQDISFSEIENNPVSYTGPPDPRLRTVYLYINVFRI